jgi:hypothetical protein
MRRGIAAVLAIAGVAGAALLVRGRAFAMAERARRDEEASERLAAAQALVATDLGDDGQGLGPFTPVSGLAASGPGELGFLSVSASDIARGVAAPLEAGDWVLVQEAQGSCLDRVASIDPPRLERGCASPDRLVARAVLHRYRVVGGALELADGAGPFRPIAAPVSALSVTPVAPSLVDARGVYEVAIAGAGHVVSGEALARGRVGSLASGAPPAQFTDEDPDRRRARRAAESGMFAGVDFLARVCDRTGSIGAALDERPAVADEGFVVRVRNDPEDPGPGDTDGVLLVESIGASGDATARALARVEAPSCFRLHIAGWREGP